MEEPQPSKKNGFKFWIQLWHGIWAIPLAFIMFIAVAVGGQLLFGDGFGSYDPSVWQAVILAAGIVVLFNFVAFLGMNLNFRHIWRYYKGEKNENGNIINKSKEDFNNLQPWQRILVLLFLYCFFMILLVSVYKIHV